MDLPTFILAERITGTISPVDNNPTEPERPGTLHYLATMHRDGRSFATHVSAPVGDLVDLDRALRAAAERAHRLSTCATREEWMRASRIHDESDDPMVVGPAHAGEADLWYRAQQAEAQALRTFLGEVAFRQLTDVVAPPATPHAAQGESDAPIDRAGRLDQPLRRRRWWVGALVGGTAIAVPVLLARMRSRHSRRRALRWMMPAR